MPLPCEQGLVKGEKLQFPGLCTYVQSIDRLLGAQRAFSSGEHSLQPTYLPTYLIVFVVVSSVFLSHFTEGEPDLLSWFAFHQCVYCLGGHHKLNEETSFVLGHIDLGLLVQFA